MMEISIIKHIVFVVVFIIPNLLFSQTDIVFSWEKNLPKPTKAKYGSGSLFATHSYHQINLWNSNGSLIWSKDLDLESGSRFDLNTGSLTHIAIGGNETNTSTHPFYIYNVNGDQIAKYNMSSEIAVLRYSDGSLLLSASQGGEVVLWSVMADNYTQLWQRDLGYTVSDVSFGSDNQSYVAIGQYSSSSDSGKLILLNTEDGSTIWSKDFNDKIWKVKINPSGEKIIATTFSGDIYVYNTFTGEKIWTKRKHSSFIFNLEYGGSSNEYLVSSATDGKFIVWNASNGDSLWSGDHNEQVHMVKFTKDKKHFFSVGYDGILKFWDIDNGDLIWSKDYGEKYRIFSVDLDVENNNVICAGRYTGGSPSVDDDGFVTVWETITTDLDEIDIQLAKFELSQNYPNPFNPTTTIKFSIKQTSDITFEVFDMLGNKIDIIEQGTKPSGSYSFTYNASNLSSGTYIYRIKSGKNYISKKMTMIK